MTVLRLVLIALLTAGVVADETTAAPALDARLTAALATQIQPDADGAIGRNRRAWFHARFQMGLHRLADHAVAAQAPESADAFLRALALAFAHQTTDGGFELVLPSALAGQKPPSAVDLASGTAFFLASAGSGWLQLERSPWFVADPACAALRARLAEQRPSLARAAAHLRLQLPALRQADARAPNRLLFTALACRTLGTLLADPALVADADRFRDDALALVAPGGWFIEGGGSDSSYNAVACALGQRLRLAGDATPALASALVRATTWQLGRILPSGEVDTTGNARVRPDGESFLGRRKEVDVAFVVEALHLAAALDRREEALVAAQRVIAAAGARD